MSPAAYSVPAYLSHSCLKLVLTTKFSLLLPKTSIIVLIRSLFLILMCLMFLSLEYTNLRHALACSDINLLSDSSNSTSLMTVSSFYAASKEAFGIHRAIFMHSRVSKIFLSERSLAYKTLPKISIPLRSAIYRAHSIFPNKIYKIFKARSVVFISNGSIFSRQARAASEPWAL